MNKKQKNITIVAIAGLSLIVILLFGQLVGFQHALPYGGDKLYEPSTDYAIGTPVLNPISSEIDYDGIINLQWNLESPYTIAGFYVFQSLNSSTFICLTALGNVYSYTSTCSTEATYAFYVMGFATIDGEEHLSQVSNIQSVQISFQESSIPTLKAIESPNTDGTIELDWNEVVNPFGGSVSGYRICRLFTTSGGWILINETLKGTTEYVDNIDVNGSYQYYIKSITYINIYDAESELESESSNIQTVYVSLSEEDDDDDDDDGDPPPVLPTNPTISINNNDTITNSLTITLTLSCDNATKMQFLLYGTNWLSWVAYAETDIITFTINGPDYPVYTIGVIFGNDNLATEIIYDSITYEAPENGDGDGNGDETEDEEEPSETDYTLVYVLVAVLGGGIGIVVFITYRKKKDKRIRYTTKKGKSRVIKPLKLKSK